MNSLTIIGNLTRDPELRQTQQGVNVCSFDVAVNGRKQKDGKQDVTYFHVSAWRELGENCAKYLAKGRKVAVVGPVSVRTYNASDGTVRAQMDVNALTVEFLSSQNEGGTAPSQTQAQAPAAQADPSGFTPVDMDEDELPF